VRFWEINSRIERQQVAQHLPLFLIGRAGTTFPSQNKRSFNTHFTGYLIGVKPLFITFGLNIITCCPYDGWNLFSAVAIGRNMGTGCANLPLCKSQQGYSPPGRRNSDCTLLDLRMRSGKSSCANCQNDGKRFSFSLGRRPG